MACPERPLREVNQTPSHFTLTANGQRLTPNAPFATSATISKSVCAEKQARRFFVSGLVQGVGFRYFAQDAAERLRLAGYVRNLRDGRVEAYAIGTEEHLLRFLAVLTKGPRGAMVHGVAEESVSVDAQYENEFSITHEY
jgi:acylphosphatase